MSRATARPAILVIDDEPNVADNFARVLTLEGYCVSTASSAAAGLAAVESAAPAAIILDLHMRNGTGVQFLERLRGMSAHRETPVAIVTGDYFIDDETTALLQSFGALIRFKPLWVKDVVALARELMKRTPPPAPSSPARRN